NSLALFQAETAWGSRVHDYSRRRPDRGFWSPRRALRARRYRDSEKIRHAFLAWHAAGGRPVRPRRAQPHALWRPHLPGGWRGGVNRWHAGGRDAGAHEWLLGWENGRHHAAFYRHPHVVSAHHPGSDLAHGPAALPRHRDC